MFSQQMAHFNLIERWFILFYVLSPDCHVLKEHFCSFFQLFCFTYFIPNIAQVKNKQQSKFLMSKHYLLWYCPLWEALLYCCSQIHREVIIQSFISVLTWPYWEMLWPLKTNDVWNETQEGISTDCGKKSEEGELESRKWPCLPLPNQTSMS